MQARIVGHTPLPLAVELTVEFLDDASGEVLARRAYTVDTDDPAVVLDQVAADCHALAAMRERRNRLYDALVERGLVGGASDVPLVDLGKHETERAPILAAAAREARETAERAAQMEAAP